MLAVSYDPVPTLRAFADRHAISFALLSDVGSHVITDLGLLNTTIAQERRAYGRPMDERHRGLPYPGTLVLDSDGVVEGRHFERSHRIRPTTRTILDRASSERRPTESIPAGVHVAEASAPGLGVEAWLDSPVVSANQLQRLHVRATTDPGVHLYTEPVADGFVPLTVSVDADENVQTRAADVPKGRPFTVTGLPEEFFVIEGTINITCEFYVEAGADTSGEPSRDVLLSIEIGYQACTDTVCHPPDRLDLELPLRLEPTPA